MQKHPRYRYFYFTTLFLCALAAGSTAHAATITWNNPSGGIWSDPNNWSPAQVPTSIDDVVVESSGTYTVTLNTHATVSSITMGGISGIQSFDHGAYILTINSTGSFGPTVYYKLSGVGGNLNGLGNITMSGALSITGNASWIYGAGQLTTSGTTTINTGVGNGYVLLINKNWVNTGSLTVEEADRISLNNSTLTNAVNGTLNLRSVYATPLELNSGTSTVNNAGTLNKDFPNTQGIGYGLIFNNTGTVNVQEGTLDVASYGTHTGTFNTVSGTILRFSNSGIPTNLGAGTSFTNAGTIDFNGGTVNFNSAMALGGNVNFSGATIGGSGDVTTSGDVNFTGTATTLTGTGLLTTSGTTTVSMGAVNGYVFLSGKNWMNTGTLTIGDDERISIYNSTLTNDAGGTLNVSSTYATPLVLNSGTATVNNAGTLNHTTLGTHGIGNGISFNNSGTVNVQAGTLDLASSGTHTGSFNTGIGSVLRFSGTTNNLDAGTSFTNAGTIDFSGGTVNFNSATALGGAVTFFGGNLGGTGDLTITGGFNITGNGFVTGTGLLTTSGTTTVNIGVVTSYVSLTGKNWTNTGALTIGGDDAINFNSGSSTFTNAVGGTLNLSSTTTNPFRFNSGIATVTNNGTMTLTAAGTHSLPTSITFNNSGAVNVDAGIFQLQNPGADAGSYAVASAAALDFLSNTRTLGAGSDITGLGTMSVSGGTVNVNNQLSIAATGTIGLSTGTLNLNIPVTMPSFTISGGGTLGGTGDLTITGGFNITGNGFVTGTGLLTTSGTTTVNIGTVTGYVSLTGKNWTNTGTLTIGGDDAINFNSGSSTFTNAVGGTLNLGSTNTNPFRYNSGTATVTNNGTMNLTAAGTHSISAGVTFHNSGSVNVNAGTFQINNSGTDTGTYAVAAGATIDLTGNTRTLGPGTDITGLGTMTVSGGTLNVNNQLSIAATGTVGLSLGTLNLNIPVTLPSFTFSGGGTLGGTGDLTITGGFNITGSGAVITGTGLLTTSGTTTVNIGAVTSYVNLVSKNWTNTGTLNIAGDDAISFNTGPSTFTNAVGGTINLSSTGANPFRYNAGTPTITNNGTINLTATGTHAIPGGITFNNSGTIRVQPGILSITSPLSTGTTNIELGGATVGTQYGQLATTGAATLSGPLNISLINSYVPLSGATFTVMTYATRSGAFSAINLPAVTGITWNSSYNATSLVLTAVASGNNLSVSKTGTGTGTVVSGDGGINCGSTCISSYGTGSIVTLTATSSAASGFVQWTGDCTGTNPVCTVTMDAAKTVTARFNIPTTINGATYSSGTTTWTLAGSPYVLTNGITIGSSATLVIEAGVIVKSSIYGFGVSGTLNALGTAGNPIYFTDLRDDLVGGDTNGDGSTTSPAAGAWTGISVYNGGTATIDHSYIKYAGYASNYGVSKTGTGSLTLTNSVISNSSYIPLNISGTTASHLISGNTITGGSTYGIWLQNAGSGVTLTGNTIANNSGYGIYLQGAGTAPNITDSQTFVNNTSGYMAFDIAASASASLYDTVFSGQPVYVIAGATLGDLTWASNRVYIPRNNAVIVSSGNTLTLNPSTIIKSSVYGLIVGGTLNSLGTSTSPVVFTDLRDDSVGGDTNGDGSATSPASAAWTGISVSNNGVANINNSFIKFAGYGSSYAVYKTGSGSLTLTNSVISNASYQPLYITGTTASHVISGNTVTSNSGHGIWLQNAGTGVTLTGNTFANNTGYGIYLQGAGTAPSITDSQTFINNTNGYMAFDLAASASASLYDTVFTSQPVYVIGGTTSGDLTWSSSRVYVLRNNGIAVSLGNTLTLNPGTIIKNSTYGISVNGTLNTNGTAGSPVYLTDLRDDTVGGDTNGDGAATSPAPGAWTGISVNNNSIANINHTFIKYAGYGSSYSVSKAGAGSLTLTNTEISRSSYMPLVITGTTATHLVSGNTITGNNNHGIWLQNAGTGVTLTGNTIANNNGYGIYLQGAGTAPNITDSQTFINNTSGYMAFDIAASASASLYDSIFTGQPAYVIGGATSGDLTWSSGRAYVIRGNSVSVSPGNTLTLSPGVVIKNSTYGIQVSGALNAAGTAGNPITFTDLRDDTVGGDTNGDGAATSPVPGGWSGISINVNGIANIDRSVIRYAGSTGTQSLYKAGAGSLTFTNSVISNSGFNGIHVLVTTASHLISGNTITASGNHGMYFDSISGATITVSNNTISNNASAGIFLSNPASGVSIINNTIFSNPNGINVSSTAVSSPLIRGNTIYGNTTNGISATGAGATPNIFQNTIRDNPVGINAASSANPLIGGSYANGNNLYSGATATSVLNSSATFTVNATYNWWGSAVGPYHAVTNPGGNLNSRVSSFVDYSNFSAGPLVPGTPAVAAVTPTAGASGVSISAPVVATFSEAMSAATITTSTFFVTGPTGTVAGSIVHSGVTATFMPSAALATLTTYTATITTGAMDLAGNALTSDFTWTFTTGATPVKTWAAAVSGNWSDGTRWSGGTVPTAGDDVQIMTAGTYTVTLDTDPIVNSLTIGSTSGIQSLVMNGRTLTLNNASTVSANGFISVYGTLTGTGTLTVSGVMEWWGGTMSGSGTTVIAPGGTMTIITVSGAAKYLDGRTLNNNGTIYWANTAFDNSIYVNNGSVLNNQAAANFNIQTTSQNIHRNVGTGGAFNNYGTVTRSNGGANSIYNIDFNNYGTVNVANGTLTVGGSGTHTGSFSVASGQQLTLASGSTHTFGISSAVSGGGFMQVDGTANVVSAGAWTGNVRIAAGGTANFNSTLSVNGLELSGTLGGTGVVTATTTTWWGGTMSGSGTTVIAPGGTMTVTTIFGAAKTLDGRTFNNYGTVNWANTSFDNTIYVNNGSVINNQAGANFNIQTTSQNIHRSVGTGGAFNNYGTVTRSNGGANSIYNIDFNNYGTVSVDGGTLSITGLFSNAATGVLGGPLAAGTGVINISSGLALGDSNTTNIDIGGTAAGSQYDQVVSGGSTTLGGTLNVRLVGGFTPTVGNSFTVMTYSSKTGTFSPINLPALSGLAWNVTQGANAVVLSVVPSTVPSVLSTTPISGATNVPVTTAITANFNESMLSSSITSTTFLVTGPSGNLSGSISASGASATFTPTAALASSTTYTATLTTGVLNLAGTGLASNYTWTFLTSAPTCTPAPSGLFSWWPGNGNALDAIGSNNGTLVSGATATAAGMVGQAFGFNGSGHVDLNIFAIDTSPGNNITVSFWMNWTGGDDQVAFSFDGYGLHHAQGHFGFTTESTGPNIFGISNSGLANRWVFVSAVFNNGNPTSNRLFIDGVEQTLAQYISPANPVSVSQHAWISGWPGNGLSKLQGRIDEVQIFNRALSAGEIASLYNAGSAGICGIPNAQVTPSPTFDFGMRSVGLATSQTFTISNAGTANLVVSGITVTGVPDFVLNVNSGGTPCNSATPTITAGSSCTVAVTWTPSYSGPSAAILMIASNDLDTPLFATSLSGNGLDTTPPAVTAVSPFNGATNVPITTVVTAAFSEIMESVNNSSFTLTGPSGLVSGNVVLSGATATFTPSAALASGTTYTAMITTGARDLAGIPLAAPYQWSFTTGTNSGHILDANTVALWRLDETTAASNALDATGNYDLMQFGSPDLVTGQVGTGRLLNASKFFQRQGNAGFGTAMNGDWTYEGWVYLAPSFSATANLFVYNGLRFSLDAADTILAEVGVLSNRKIYLHQWHTTGTYTERSSNFTLQTGRYYHVAVSRTAQGGNLFTYRIYVNGVLDSVWANIAGPSYAVSGALHYIGLGNYTGISGLGSGGNVLNGRLDDTRISNVARTDVEILGSCLGGGAACDSFPVTFAATPPGGGTLSGMTVQTIASGGTTSAVRATANTGYQFVNWTGTGGFVTTTTNPLIVTNVTNAMAITANFAVTDATPPTVLSTTPANGASNVTVGSRITAYFSEAMSAATITPSTFFVTGPGGSVAGTILASGATATFTPSAALSSSTTYTATITTGVRDIALNPMVANHVWSFTTADVTAPTGTVAINSGAGITNALSVALTLSCSDTGTGCSTMELSNNGSTWSAPEPVASSKAWNLLPGDGIKIVRVRFTDAAGNSAEFSSSILLDMSTPVFSSTAPAANSFVNTPQVGYTLNESISAGTITFQWTGGAVDSRTTFTYAMTAGDRTAGPHSISTGWLPVDGGIYAVTFGGTDLAGNSASVANVNVTFDTTAAAVILTGPASNTFINAARITYTLNTSAVSGRIVMSRTGGTADALSPYAYDLTASDLTAGNHSVDTGFSLVNGALYEISVTGVTDLAGNVSAPVSSINVTFDTQAVTITNAQPFLRSIITNANVGYILSEDALFGKVVFTRTGGAVDGNSPHSYTFGPQDLTRGIHTLVNTGITLVEQAFYTVTFSFDDRAGNPTTSVSNAMVFFDSRYGSGPAGNVDNTDGQNIVNDADVLRIKRSMGSRPGDANWDPVCDLNRDNRIDENDLLLLQIHYGK